MGWCERNNKIPVVHWDQQSLYFQPQGYNGSYNVWEYFFEPLSGLNYQPGNTVHRNYFAPDGSGIEYRSFNGLDMIAYKYWAHDLINKYIKIKPSIKAKIDHFYNRYMVGKKTIGIHLRGTDKQAEVKQVPVSRIIA